MKKYICLFSVTLIILAAIVMPGYFSGEPAEVDAVEITKQDVANTISVNGRLKYRSGQTVTLTKAAYILTVNVENGNRVKKGELLFTYYTPDEAYSSLVSQYASSGNLAPIISSLAGSPDASSMKEELKKYCTLESFYSEYEGSVTDLSINEDDIISEETAVMKITNDSAMEIPVSVSENEIADIRLGQQAEITFPAIPDKVYEGEVTAIADEADQTGGLTGKETTVEVTISLNTDEIEESSDERLRVGYSAGCTITTSVDENVLLLPYEQLRTDDQGDYAFVIHNNTAKKRYIKTGREYQSGVEVLSGINAGDLIIREPEGVFDDQRVILKK